MRRTQYILLSLLLLTAAMAIAVLPGAAMAADSPAPAAEPCEGCAPEQEAATVPTQTAEPDGGAAVDGADPECDPMTDLQLICNYEENGQAGTFWENGMDDYNAGLLTVNYRLDNTGPRNLVNVRVNDATATNGVKIATELPLPLGIIEAGKFITFHLKWQLPQTAVTGFRTDIEICADCPTEEELIDEPDLPPVDKPVEAVTVAATLPATGSALLAFGAVAFAAGLALLLAGRARGRGIS